MSLAVTGYISAPSQPVLSFYINMDLITVDVPSKSDLNSSLSLIESQQGSISLVIYLVFQVKAERNQLTIQKLVAKSHYNCKVVR